MRLGGWVGLGGEETGESVSDGMQPDGLMVLHVVQQVWTCGGGWRLCRLCRTGYQGSQLKGKAPCRKSRHQQLDGGAASPCVGEAMIPLGCATQLNPPPPPPPLLHPPKIPHYLARAHPEPTVQLSVSRRGNYTPAETQEEAYRSTHTTRRRPCDRQAAARRRYYPQRVDCRNSFSSLDDSHSKKKKRPQILSYRFQLFLFLFLFLQLYCFMFYFVLGSKHTFLY